MDPKTLGSDDNNGVRCVSMSVSNRKGPSLCVGKASTPDNQIQLPTLFKSGRDGSSARYTLACP